MRNYSCTVGEICRVLEAFAPLSWQEDYDNCGLILGRASQEVSAVLLCIDVTEDVIDEALELGCQLIVSHHPLLFSGLKRIGDADYVERCVVKAIKNDIAVYAAHTCWDNAPQGVNYKIAEKIGLRNVTTLVPKSGCQNERVGSGVIGELEMMEKELDFLNRLKSIFSIKCIKHSPLLNKAVKRVALCGGSGSEFLQTAISRNADVFLTADVKYHTFFAADGRILIADIGHFESEQFTKEIFFEQIQKKIPKFAIHFSKIKTNQINYL